VPIATAITEIALVILLYTLYNKQLKQYISPEDETEPD
jgi:hypothetical protein